MTKTKTRFARPLFAASTYRGWLYLILGGALAVPPALAGGAVGAQFDSLLGTVLSGSLFALLLGLTTPMRWVEARLLDALVLRESVDHRHGGRRTGALLVLAHLWLGVLTLYTLSQIWDMVLLPAIHMLPDGVFRPFGLWIQLTSGWQYWPIAVIGALLAVGLCYLINLMRTSLSPYAARVFSPSEAQRLAMVEEELRRSADRDRISTEVHDSVGHALTLHAMQAGAAQQMLDTDPEFAREMLADIQRTSQQAAEDLDRVLAMLHSEEHDAPTRGLDELDRLAAGTRTAGTELTLRREGELDRIPERVSTEAYRIVQESLTNVVRHGAGSATLLLRVTDTELYIWLSNPVRDDRPEPGASRRGISGMSARTARLNGSFRTEEIDGNWQLTARLPLSST